MYTLSVMQVNKKEGKDQDRYNQAPPDPGKTGNTVYS